MNLIDFASSPLSVLPPLVALSLAIVTRRVLLSLGVGIFLGALLLADYSIGQSLQYIATQVGSVFVKEGAINAWNMSIVGFLLLLGMMTALLTLSGGTRAFAQWAQVRVKSKRGSKLLAAFLGVFIFVDDYFNSLAVGSISRPVTDRFYVSRAKLAYILDSTAAPMCVVMPASSWGAYIMTIIGGILVSHGIEEYSALGAYLRLVPMNFYAIFALLMVFAVVWFQMDIGQMRKHEIAASQGRGFDEDPSTDTQEAHELNEELDIRESERGTVLDLVLPIVFLVVATIGAMIWTGASALAESGQSFDIFGAFENTNVGTSLVYGGLVGLAMAFVTVLRQKLPTAEIAKTLWIGAKSMFGAILILIFAWTIGSVIGDMKTVISLLSYKAILTHIGFRSFCLCCLVRWRFLPVHHGALLASCCRLRVTWLALQILHLCCRCSVRYLPVPYLAITVRRFQIPRFSLRREHVVIILTMLRLNCLTHWRLR